jgi:tRNA U38,U39,U40 pseudouridine synthase TruA
MLEPRLERVSLVLFLGYHSVASSSDIGDFVVQRLRQILSAPSEQSPPATQQSPWHYIKVLGSTQSTVPKSRPSCLGPDLEDKSLLLAAAEDVVIVNLLAPVGIFEMKALASEGAGTTNATTTNVLAMVGRQLADTLRFHYADSPNGVVRLHGLRYINASAKLYLHAEQSCTQHVYHYLLPVSWLDQPETIQAWYERNRHVPYPHLRESAPAALRHFKAVLKGAESPVAATRQQSRFGGLGLRIPRYWHNYANPRLRLPPNYDAVQRVVDRARVIDFVRAAPNNSNDTARSDPNELYLVCAVAGDEFLQEQVCRIIGTSVAMARGWLPADFWSRSLQRDTLLETVLAPATHCLYKATSRFHYAELAFCGQALWDDSHAVYRIRTKAEETLPPVEWMQKQLLPLLDRHASTEWQSEVRNVVAPRMVSRLSKMPQSSMSSDQLNNQRGVVTSSGHAVPSSCLELTATAAAPNVYRRVLDLLRQIVATSQWPATSTARSQVIHSSSLEGHPTATDGRSGSFTVVSETMFDCSKFSVPLANANFPELCQAVFELEQELIAASDILTTMGGLESPHDAAALSPPALPRLPSSHCAINANAQFTPHVDSGRGLGQSLSMIVGLGEYTEGQLVVEGQAHDICYQPLQFDGWKLRHWTLPFQGERFSLVWFTPEGMVIRT